jgi:uncharacterized membrane protein YccC
MTMPSSQLKRAERAIQTSRDQVELPPETAGALQEIVDVIRTIEGRLSTLEGKGHLRPSAEMELPNPIRDDDRPHRVAACCVDLGVTALDLASAYVVPIDGLE